MARVVSVFGMSLEPRARCLGWTDADGNEHACTWQHDHSHNARDRAKDHAKYKPGHVVRVNRDAFDDYKLEGS